MTQKELYEKIAEETKLPQSKVKEVIEALGYIATDAFKANADDKIVLPGIGTIKVKARGARSGRNPKTGETIEISAMNKPVLDNFKSQDLFKAIN